jgi:hypothetical protein
VIPATLLPHTVVVVRPATSTDAYGDSARDYGAGATRTTITGRLQQDARSESADALRDSAVQLWTLFTNATDIRVLDRLEWAGHPQGSVTFEVVGPPEPTYAGPADVHHLEVSLRQQAG